MGNNKELTWHATAAANILEARSRSGRAITRKSRAGCKTCKARHVKCDQNRPCCHRCVKSGRQCEGYVDIPSPEPKKNGNTLLGLHLSQSLGLQQSDRRIFDYFLSWTAPRLAGTLDKEFWCGRVLQVAQTEPVIRDAILSMSLLYEHPQFLVSFHNRTTASAHEDLAPGSWLQSDRRAISNDGSDARPTVAKPKADKFHTLALQYYNRAIQGFKNRMDAGDATPLLALLSCVLFISIETMRDNAFAALALFKQAAKLLRSFEPSHIKQENGLLLDLRHRIGRISLMAAIAGHPEELDGNGEPLIGEGLSFTSLSGARDVLYQIMFDSHAFLRDIEYRADLKRKMTHTGSPNDADAWSYSTEMTEGTMSLPVSLTEEPDDGITRLYYGCQDAATPASAHASSTEAVHPTFLPYVMTPSMLERRDRLKDRFQKWFQAFMNLYEVQSEATHSMLIHYHVYSIWLSVCFDPFETAFDHHSSDFAQVLHLTQQYVSCKPEQQTYTMESQILAPLYFIATRCRVPSFRRRAIDFIKQAPKKECTFGASSAAEIIIRLIAIEEEGLFPPDGNILSHHFDDSVLPPDSARIRGFEIIVNRPEGRHYLRVTRYSRRDDGCLIKSMSDHPIE